MQNFGGSKLAASLRLFVRQIAMLKIDATPCFFPIAKAGGFGSIASADFFRPRFMQITGLLRTSRFGLRLANRQFPMIVRIFNARRPVLVLAGHVASLPERHIFCTLQIAP
jgi:hypothetical protein